MINLLPMAMRVERMYGRRNKILVGIALSLTTTALLVAGVMIVSLQFLGADTSSHQKELDENNAKIAVLEAENKNIASVSAKLKVTNKIYEETILFSELIPQIGSLLPQGSIINGLSLTGGESDPLALDVSLTDATIAPILQQNLVQSSLFEAADINSITPTGGDTSTYRFNASVTVSFTGSAETKKKADAAARAKAAAAAAAASEESGGQ